MVKRYHWSYLEMEEYADGGYVDYEDYAQLSRELDSKSYAMEMQKNATAAYMRDYEREHARVQELETELDELYRSMTCNGESYG